ncbi:MAG: AAA family ATPase [Burkholderiaceae bacterium]
MPHAALAAALDTLDEALAQAVDAQARHLGPDSLLDPWRGLRVERSDVERLLVERGPDVIDPCSPAPRIASAARRIAPFERMAEWLSLTDIELASILIALAPDIDLRYERLYAYLQDDVTRKRPGIDLIANLLARDAAERLALIARFDADAPLVCAGIVQWRGGSDVPRLARAMEIDPLWRNWMLGRVEFDESLAACARLLVPASGLDGLLLDAATRAAADRLLDAHARHGTLRLLLHGPHGTGKAAFAHALAHDTGQRLLDVDVRDWATPVEMRRQLQRVFRACALFSALPFLRGVAALSADAQALRAFVDTLAVTPASFVVAAEAPWGTLHASPLAAARLALTYPAAAQRCRIWQQALAGAGLALQPGAAEAVSQTFSLSRSQIEQAAIDARLQAELDGLDSLGQAQLAAAARQQSGAELARHAQRITPQADFATLITVAEVSAQLREICARVATRETVRRDWAGGCVHARGVGITALFTGPSGTGKTLAAEAVASELGLDLYRIDLAAVVSKYIGETEKNLDRVFTAAERANAVLFFDEADSLFGKRSEVKDAHDRYANIEIAYLLQKMEQFDGLAILATNLKQNLDDAFARRLTFTLNFPFPEQPERERLWHALWPPHAPKADDVDLEWFAREFRLSGGNIRNTVLAAAHLAAANGRVVTREHLLHATRREFQKLGKVMARQVV